MTLRVNLRAAMPRGQPAADAREILASSSSAPLLTQGRALGVTEGKYVEENHYSSDSKPVKE
jgi:hypothetical protein